ncbi:MAG: rubrerythrin family protein [Anaerovoracaceae bacterium]|jgi:rubrerythrin
MPNSLEGTRTAENLAKAFIEESQVGDKYLFFARIAEGQGYPTIGKQYREVADQEHGHAEAFYIYLTEGLADPVLTIPVSVEAKQGTTSENLYFTTLHEYDACNTYNSYGEIAMEEGFESIGRSFFAIAQVAQRHFLQFHDLLQRYQSDMLYKAAHKVIWECIVCGYHFKGFEAPRVCPGCLRKRAYFKIGCEVPY